MGTACSGLLTKISFAYIIRSNAAGYALELEAQPIRNGGVAREVRSKTYFCPYINGSLNNQNDILC